MDWFLYDRDLRQERVNQRAEYRLSVNATYLHIALETWENWACGKKLDTAFVRGLNLDDINVKK